MVGASDCFFTVVVDEEETMLRPKTLSASSGSFRRLRTLACILGAASLGACASAGGAGHSAGPTANRVVVQNYSFERLAVYLSRNGGLWRLGDVESLSDGSFQVPRALMHVDEVHFVARPLGGRPFRSESFAFPTGATAVWTIETQVAMSHVMLR